MREARHKRPHIRFHLCEIARIDKSIETKSRLVVARDERLLLARGFLCGVMNVLNLIVVIVAQLCEYAKTH